MPENKINITMNKSSVELPKEMIKLIILIKSDFISQKFGYKNKSTFKMQI